MKDSHYRISLDIHSTQSQVSLPVKQGDTSRKVFISLCEGGKPYVIEKDCFAVFSAKKPDGTNIKNNCVIADNVIEYTITEQTTAKGGMVDCEINLYGVGGGLITSPHFTIIVDSRAVSDEEIAESFSDYSALTEILTEFPKFQDTVDEVVTEFMEAVDAEVTEFTDAVDAKLSEGKNVVSNALKGTASGNPIRLDDVSPVEHEMKVKLKGKNLLSYPYHQTTSSSCGIIFTDNGDGTITVSGTPTQAHSAGFVLSKDASLLRKGVTYTLSLGSYDTSGVSAYFHYADETGKDQYAPNQVTWSDSYTFKKIYLQIDKTKEYNVVLYPQLEIGTTETAYVPPLDPTTVTLKRYGATESDNPQTYTPNADGTVSVTSLYPTTTLMTDMEGVTIDVEYNKDANKVIEELIDLIGIGNSFIADVTILASKWVGTSSPYSQVVTVEGATKRSQVDLTPSAEQLAIFHNKDLAFVTENNNGVITVYAIGQKPTNDYTIQATVTEVKV